jgi:putative ABC transport system substrate-binding protein
MNKKTLVILVAAVLYSAQVALAQSSGKVPRIAYLATQSQPGARFEAFRQGLRDLGYVEGQHIRIDYRGHEDRTQRAVAANELIREKVSLIVTHGAATRTAELIGTVPVVFGYSGDPVEAGLVKSLARPGGNMTGVTMLAFELVGKRLEFLKEAVPRVSRVSVLSSPAHPGEQRELSESQKTAHAVGITLLYH